MEPKSLEQQIHSFTQFARFIADRFEVEIVFDGLEAHTDGTTITLPNLLGLSSREIDFLYGVLLHEVGHIKYSTFTKESFALLKSKAHFQIANGLEDARIENLLIQEYDGAEELLAELYHDFLMDPQYRHRVLQLNKKQLDLFGAVVSYAHNRIIKLKVRPDLTPILSKTIQQQLRTFIKKHDFDKLLDSAQLTSWGEVVQLSEVIYDLLFGPKQPDKTEDNPLPAMIGAVDKILSEHVATIEALEAAFQEKTQAQQDRLQDLLHQQQEFSDKYGSQLQADEQTLERLENQLDEAKTATKLTKSLQRLQERGDKTQTKLAKAQQKLDKFNKLVETQQEKFMNGEESLQEELTRNLYEQEAAQKKVNQIQKQQEKISSDQVSKQEDLRKLSPQAITNNQAELSSQRDQLKKQIQELRQQEQSLMEKIDQTKDSIKQQAEAHGQKMGTEVRKLQKAMSKSGLPIALGSEVEVPGWAEAGEVQQAFDEQASSETKKFVSAGLGSGNRDMLVMVNQAKREVEALDLVEVFKSTQGFSKLDYLNSSSGLRNTKEGKGSKVAENQRPHLPLTTMFDRVVMKTTAADTKELARTRERLREPARKLLELFQRKLKAQRQDRFHGNQEEGQLDARNLWKLATDTDDNYYEVARSRNINQVVAAIALDLSGSMDKNYTASGKKLTEIALLLSEALGGCYVRHEIAGYHAPVETQMRSLSKSATYNRSANCLETVIYRRFTDRSAAGLTNLELQATDNSDGESLKIIGQRLLRERGRRRILFVVSDGKPWLSDGDAGILDADLRKTLAWCAANKIEVIGLGFNPEAAVFYSPFLEIKKADYADLVTFLEQVL